MNALWWLAVPLAPTLGLLLLLIGRDRVVPWLWLACLPALLLATVSNLTPSALDLDWLWPGAIWHAEDLLTRGFLGFTALLWGAASIYGISTQQKHPQRLRFWVFWLVSLTGNLLLIIAQDGVSFYVGFTLMSLAAYALVVHLGGPGPRQAGRVYLQLAIAGELMIYAALMLRIHEAGGALDLASWQTVSSGGITTALLIVGFGLKAGFWPLHVWLPLAHPAAPAAASAVLSGAMIKAGILGLWRFLPEGDALLQTAADGLIVVGLFSAFYGVVLGLMQTQAKSALAYSSVSQVGYLLVILALAWRHPEAPELWATLLVLYAVHHGLAKGSLFMGAGLAKAHTLTPWQWLLLIIPGLALAGLPFSTGGAVKTLLKDGFYEAGLSQWIPVLVLGGMGTLLLITRVMVLIWQHQPDRTAPKAPATLTWSWALISLMPLVVPWVWPAMNEAWRNSMTLSANWALLWPLVVSGALAALVWQRGWSVPQAWWQRLNAKSSPARGLSLLAKMMIQRPALRDRYAIAAMPSWRPAERKWNRFWQRETVVLSAWLITLLLLISLFW